MLIALVAIIMGSQQLLVLPTPEPQNADEGAKTSISPEVKQKNNREQDSSELQHLQAIVVRLRDTYKERPNTFQIFALQAPMMLLMLSVVSFLAGLCSVILAPLAKNLEWGDNSKVCFLIVCVHRYPNLRLQIAVVFGAAGILCVVIFSSASLLMHRLFSLQPAHEPRRRSLLSNAKPANTKPSA